MTISHVERIIREKIADIVKGVAEGCLQSDAALIGGETAEHPGLMPEEEYDLAGFAVGIVDEKDMITGQDLKAGDGFNWRLLPVVFIQMDSLLFVRFLR